MKVKPQEPVLLTRYSWLAGTQGRVQGEETIITGRYYLISWLLKHVIFHKELPDNMAYQQHIHQQCL